MIKKLLLPALVGFFAFTIASCDTDPCKDLEGKCGTGTCFEGACVCDEGFEADAEGICNTEWSAKFLGTYNGVEIITANTTGLSLYELGTYNYGQRPRITRLSESNISIFNFAGQETDVDFVVSKVNDSDASAVTFVYNNVTDAKQIKYTGSGTISGNVITGTYRATFFDNTYYEANYTFTKI